MVRAPVDAVLEILEDLEKSLLSHKTDQIQTLKVEFRFLRTFIRSTAKWRYMTMVDTNLHSVLKMVEDELTRAISEISFVDRFVFYLLEKVEIFKPKVREAYLVSSKYSLHNNSPMGADLLVDLVDSILENLKDLHNSEENLIVSVKEQVLALEHKLMFMRSFVAFAAKRCSDHEKMEVLFSHIESVADGAAHFSYLCWLSKAATKMQHQMKDMLSDLLQMIKPSTPESIEMYVAFLRDSQTSRSEIYMAGEVVVNFVNFLLEDLLHPVKGGFETLRNGLVLMMALIMEPTEEEHTEDWKPILSRTEAVVSHAASFICSFQADKEKDKSTTDVNLLLSALLESMELVKTEVRDIQPELSDVPPFNFPRTDGLGFMDFLLGNLRKLLKYKANLVAFVKHQIEIILGELEFFRSFLKDTTEQRKAHKELKDLETYVTGAAYEAEHVIDSFLLGDRPIWYHILRISAVVRVIQFIKGKVTAIYNEDNHHVALQNDLTTSNSMSLEANSAKIDEVVVGFNDEAETIIERLTRGSVQLDIVAIVGMPGLGKTTLAKKVYSELSVRYHFYVRAWCYISQFYEKKRDLLLTILSQVIELTDEIHDKSDDDLDQVLRQFLKGQRYLVVMDDLWNTRAWNDLKSSFPNDNNGSRILFTSRLRDVALQAKQDCNPHSLRLFSDDESWELLEKKLFQQERCPPELLELGRKIAKNCKGLPLSTVVVAGLLAKTEKTQDWWKFVAERLGSERFGGTIHYMDILDLSYKHLPDHLKPCFLYFGAFAEDEEVPVWKLVRLWIAEGFVHETELKSLEDVAEDYLVDLISRSLVIVSKRRSKGGVKTCRVHDVLLDFCVEKAKKENLLELKWGSDNDYAAADDDGNGNGYGGGGGAAGDDNAADNDNDHDKSGGDGIDSSITYQVRRVGIYSKWKHFGSSMPIGPRVRSLLFFATSDSHLSSDPCHVTGISHKFKLLNVLDLGCINIGDFFPDEIELLVHLRFLAVRGRMNSIPSSIASLWNLETFLVKGLKGEVVLPDTIWNMVSLRYLHVNNRVAFTLEDTELMETSKLENLVSVSTPSLAHGRRAMMITRRLVNVRKLKCIFLESWDSVGNCNRFPVLNDLSQLESLKVLYYGMVRYPCVFSFPPNLKKLTLSKFRLPWKEISTIAKLPNLEVLKLLFKAFEGKQWKMGEGEFPKLKFLKLDSLTIEQWNASADHLPCLQQLVLQSCKQLEEIPSGFGDIDTLQMIEVQWCSISAAKSARQIQEEQQDMGIDELKVFIYPPDLSFSSSA